MKKFFALLAVVLAVVSCQKDVDVDVNLGGDLATISVVLPEDAITRAGGTDSAASGLDNTDKIVRVVMHIYDEAGRVSNNRYVDYLEGGARTVNFDIRLVPNREYTFVAWADQVDAKVDEDKYFNTKSEAGLANVTLISGTWTAMNEERDAFTATHTEANYTSSSNITLKLIRPFAKLRVVATDMEFLNDLDVQPKTAKVSYATKHYNAFNAVTGVAINKENTGVEHEYDIASYGEDWRNGADMTLFTDYFFAADEQEEVNFSLEVFDQNNTRIKYNNFNTAIPVKRNNLTTIAGNILTEGNNVTVTVDPVFAGKQEWPSESAEKLAAAAMFGGEVTLTEDVVLNQPLDVKSNMTLNLGGKTLEGVINVNEDAKLTVNNGTIVNGDNSKSGITSNGDLTLNDVTIESARHAVRIESGNVVINGGEYKVNPISKSTLHALNVGDDNTVANVTIKGGTFIGPNGTMADSGSALNVRSGSTVTIEGGDFSGGKTKTLSANQGATLTVKGGTFDQDPSNYCAPGYYALQYETGKYTVQAFDAAARTLTINSKDEFLKLNTLNAKWAEFFSDGNGTAYSNYATQNGGKGIDFYYKWDWTIKLNVDIDLEDATLTAPVASLEGFGYFDGQNHTIKNATIENTSEAGLFNADHCGLKNINLNNIVVKGGSNGNAGILTSDCHKSIDNITITNSSVVGGKYTGGVVGYGYCDVTNCTLTNCVVKGCYKCGGVIGYICASENNVHNVTGNTLTNCTVTDAGEHTPGKSEYVLGKVVGNYNCNGTCKDNVIDNMTTTAKALIGKIEAGNVVNESNNYVSTNVDSSEDLAEALAKGENVTLSQDVNTEAAKDAPYGNKYAFKQDGGVIDGNGHELHMECYGDDYGIMTSGGTIKNITIKEGCRAVMIMCPQQDVILDNVKIGGDGVLYPINTGESGAEGVNLIVTNSTLAGWTSYGLLIESASFTNVEFKQGTYYNNIYGRVLKPYVNTTLTNCSFVEHMNLDLSSLNAGHKIVMKNCKVDGQAVTADTFTIPTTDAQYDTELFTIDLPSWATSINDCVVFE